MEITPALRKRFADDTSIPIKVYVDPVFVDRLDLFDPFFDSNAKWNQFVGMLSQFKTEDEYVTYFHLLKEGIIHEINGHPDYYEFTEHFHLESAPQNTGFPRKDIYHADNIGQEFLSIDMRRANFNSLRHYSPDIFKGAATWEEYIGKYTSFPHLIKSKRLRETILGCCRCSDKQITYEKWLTDKFLTDLLTVIDPRSVCYFSHDEIVLRLTDTDIGSKLNEIGGIIDAAPVPFKAERFKLYGIGFDGKHPEAFMRDKYAVGEFDFKKVDNIEMPYVIRELRGQNATRDDGLFMHEKGAAYLINPITVQFYKTPTQQIDLFGAAQGPRL